MRLVTVADSRVRMWAAGICLCLLQMPLSVAAKDHAADSRWASGSIVIDGNNNEWPMPFPLVAKDARIQYSIANDGKTLYVCVKASDEVEKKKLIVNGLTLMLDTAGDKREKLMLNISVVFPGDAQHENDNDDTAQEMPGSKKAHAAPLVPLLLRIHRQEMNENEWQPLAPAVNVQAAVGVNDFTELVWEVAIPFSMLGWSGVPADPGHELSVGILAGGVDDGDLTPAHLPGTEPVPEAQPDNAMKIDAPDKSSTGQKPGGKEGMGNAPQGGGSGAMQAPPGGHSPEMEPGDQPVSTASYADERIRLAHTDKVWKNLRLKENPQ